MKNRAPGGGRILRGRHLRAVGAKTTVQWGLKHTKSRAVAVKGLSRKCGGPRAEGGEGGG